MRNHSGKNSFFSQSGNVAPGVGPYRCEQNGTLALNTAVAVTRCVISFPSPKPQ